MTSVGLRSERDGSDLGTYRLPAGATILRPEYTGPVTIRVLKGRGYEGGHNTAARLGWVTTYPTLSPEAVAWWDYTHHGLDTGYYPAIKAAFPFSPTSVARRFLRELRNGCAWGIAPYRVVEEATRLGAIVANGVPLSPAERETIRQAVWRVIGPPADAEEAASAWSAAVAAL